MKPKKSLGQNFLKSEKALKAMVLAVNIQSNDTVLEIGPGQVLKGLLKKIDPKLEVKNFGSIKDLQQIPVS